MKINSKFTLGISNRIVKFIVRSITSSLEAFLFYYRLHMPPNALGLGGIPRPVARGPDENHRAVRTPRPGRRPESCHTRWVVPHASRAARRSVRPYTPSFASAAVSSSWSGLFPMRRAATNPASRPRAGRRCNKTPRSLSNNATVTGTVALALGRAHWQLPARLRRTLTQLSTAGRPRTGAYRGRRPAPLAPSVPHCDGPGVALHLVNHPHGKQLSFAAGVITRHHRCTAGQRPAASLPSTAGTGMPNAMLAMHRPCNRRCPGRPRSAS